jgi:hypothetical protein
MARLSPDALDADNTSYGAGPGRDDWIGDTARTAFADGHFRNIDEWVIKHRDFGNGHKEAMLYRRQVDGWKAYERLMWGHTRAKRGEALDREESIKKSAARARAQCRLTCKTMLVNSLWTLTYKKNVVDRDLCLKHMKEFIRRVKRVIPDFRYVWALEHQTRGAYHVHMGTHSLPKVFLEGGIPVKSWDLMRRIWRSVTGEYGGNFDEAKDRHRWHRKGSMQRCAAAIARYISKYVGKSFMDDQDLNRKRWNHSDVHLPHAVRERFSGDQRAIDLIELVYAAVGERIISTWWDRGRECFFIETDDTGRPPGIERG